MNAACIYFFRFKLLVTWCVRRARAGQCVSGLLDSGVARAAGGVGAAHPGGGPPEGCYVPGPTPGVRQQHALGSVTSTRNGMKIRLRTVADHKSPAAAALLAAGEMFFVFFSGGFRCFGVLLQTNYSDAFSSSVSHEDEGGDTNPARKIGCNGHVNKLVLRLCEWFLENLKRFMCQHGARWCDTGSSDSRLVWWSRIAGVVVWEDVFLYVSAARA